MCPYIYIYPNWDTTTPIPDACRCIPLEKLVCLLDFSHLYAPVSVSYSQIRFFLDFWPNAFAGELG